MDTLNDLKLYVQSVSRVCPQPLKWNELWEMLPNKRRIDSGWNPALPLILGGWWHSTDEDKRQRFLMHIKYAYDNGVIDDIARFLYSLKPGDWYCG